MSTAARIRWTVDLLDVTPSDRLLEIGCGPGVAVSLVCESLGTGSITAIDRSQPMIEQAVRRNRAHVDTGRAAFHAVALEDAGFLQGGYGEAFAINVRLFGTAAEPEARALRALLAPGGTLSLVQHHPSEKRTRAVTAELAAALERNGFVVRAIDSEGEGDSLMTRVSAAPVPEPDA